MSSISGISGTSYNSYTSSGKIASGNKLQSTADGASELTISEQEKAQIGAYNAGTQNMQSGKNVLNVSDGALANIGDSLQRMRELAVQASNTATMTDSDRQNIQAEIDQLKQGIGEVAANTTYNTKNLLDGSNTEFKMASDANGGTASITTANATLDSLGISDFDVTGEFDISKIDEALEKVNSSRSQGGAQSNRLDYAINNNKYTSENLVGANSRLADLDMPKAISDKKKEETIQTYQTLMQRKKMEDEETKVKGLFM